jgi:hypothetical protein
LESCEWQIHYDSAPVHSVQLLQQFLAKNYITQVREPPYSPVMAPSDILFSLNIEKTMKGKRFEE